MNDFFSPQFDVISWLDRNPIKGDIVHDDLSGGVSISFIQTIPVRFGQVVGHFDCCHNKLTSLFNAPHTVGGNFYAFKCQIKK